LSDVRHGRVDLHTSGLPKWQQWLDTRAAGVNLRLGYKPGTKHVHGLKHVSPHNLHVNAI